MSGGLGQGMTKWLVERYGWVACGKVWLGSARRSVAGWLGLVARGWVWHGEAMVAGYGWLGGRWQRKQGSGNLGGVGGTYRCYQDVRSWVQGKDSEVWAVEDRSYCL